MAPSRARLRRTLHCNNESPVGVLSDLRNFFTELRTNLDSVEALAQEQGAGSLHPEQLLALLAKEEGEELPPPPSTCCAP